jgi:SH3-like domain-containing protein
MRRMYIWLLILIVPTGLLIAREMSVQVREAQLRATPSFLSPVKERIPYTERVNILQEQGDWMHVQPLSVNTQGWMHSSALTRKKLTLTAGDQAATQSVTTDEQALAGKGFNAQVESEYRQRNANLRFEWVDREGGLGRQDKEGATR